MLFGDVRVALWWVISKKFVAATSDYRPSDSRTGRRWQSFVGSEEEKKKEESRGRKDTAPGYQSKDKVQRQEVDRKCGPCVQGKFATEGGPGLCFNLLGAVTD